MNRRLLLLLLCMTVPAWGKTFRDADVPSLQRGARLFMNYCAGCHALKYLRYERLGLDLGLDKKALQDNLMWSTQVVGEPIQVSLPVKEAVAWFGQMPPDLSLTARAKGREWVYDYLRGFYADAKRPFGVNNRVQPDTTMPNVLESYAEGTAGSMTPEAFDSSLVDIVSFLIYVAEPVKGAREKIGLFVLGFFILLAVLAYALKRSYWQEHTQ